MNTDAAVFHSSALTVNADSAAAWSLPEMVGFGLAMSSAAIDGDDQGNLLVIYSRNIEGNGVYFTSSDDFGATWSEPAPIYLTNDNDLVPYSLHLSAGSDQQLRAVWNVVTSMGVDKLLYFANYDIRGANWSDPVELDRRIDVLEYFGPSFPAIADTGSEIVIMYNTGNPVEGRPVGLGRPIQQVLVSGDNGQSWTGPSAPFPFHTGRSGEHALVADGTGVPQALFVQRIESTDDQGKYTVIGGIWHSGYKNGSWTNPERYVTTVTPHDIRAVVSQGNVLLVTWREDPGGGKHGVWFSYTILDAPELPVVPLQTAQPADSDTTHSHIHSGHGYAHLSAEKYSG